MAYYAAVISLKLTLNRLLNSSQVSILPPCRRTIKRAYREVRSLEELLRKLEKQLLKNCTNEKVNALLGQIRDATCKLEDSLESHVSDQSLSHSESLKEGSPINLCPDLEDIKQGRTYFKKMMKKLEKTIEKILPEEDDVFSPSIQFGGEETEMVGYYDLFEEIKDSLTRCVPTYHPTGISIVGMAGIGKTTLVQKIYTDELAFNNFECCAWITIGPESHLKKVLVHDKLHVEGEWIFVEDLRTRFKGRKYLIVIDDIWNKQDVDKLESSLPTDHFIGSVILLTTRLQEVAKYADRYERFSENKYFQTEDEDEHLARFHQMRFLSEEESWILLRQKVFGKDWSCPFHLEKAGRKIAKKCEGLPLTIVTVANILSKSEKTPEYWNKVAEDQYSLVFTNAYEQMSKVIFPSYKYLPQDLKATFLYLGLFPPSTEIRASKLIRLWIAEGFIEPSQFISLENIGVIRLRVLVSSNVVLVDQYRSSNGVKTCRLNSAFWYLCTREARKEKFFHVLLTYPNSFTESVESQRRFCVFNNTLFGIKEVHKLMESIISVHSLLCSGPEHQYPVPLFTNLRLLRVLDALTVRFYNFPVQVLKLVHLRYLALTCDRNIPPFISDLGTLQYLIIRRLLSINKSSGAQLYLPIEIWNMRELKRLQIMGINLPDPCGVLPNLLSISYINANGCTKEILERVPNLEKLGIRIELALDTDETTYKCFDHLSVLERLESFKCVIVNPNLSRSHVVAPPASVETIPYGLKKLSLSGFGYPWECMRVIAQLPSLRVLKLRCYAFRGPKWVIHEGEFERIGYLVLEDTDLMHWEAPYTCFPSLQNLIIRHCYKLKEFPCPMFHSCDVKLVDCPFLEGSIREKKREFRKSYFYVRSSWYD